MTNVEFPNKDGDAWKKDPELLLKESGLIEKSEPPKIDLNDPKLLPAGGSRFAIPPHLSTVGLINQGLRSYYYQFDPALKKSREDARACRSDPVIFQAILESQTPIVQLDWVIEPFDETNPKEVEAAKKVSQAFSRTPCLQQALRELLEALWFGRAGLQLTYKWDDYDPSMMIVKDWSPLQGDSLVARWANNDWGMLVNAAFDGDTEPYNLGRAHYFTPSEMEAVVIHQGEREPPDFFDTTGAGAIKGIGWRSRVFWYWYIKANLFAILMDLVERIGQGIWIAGYDQSNPSGRADFENSIAAYKSKRVLSIPQNEKGESKYSLRILEPGSVQNQIIESMIKYLDGCMRAVIMGHNVGPGAEIQVGGDPTSIAADSISRSHKYHANNLAETITTKWLPTYYKYMYPKIPVGKFSFLTDHPNASAILSYSKDLMQMGLGVDLNALARLCGVPVAIPGSTIGSNVQSLNPVPLQAGQPPENVPIATNKGQDNGE